MERGSVRLRAVCLDAWPVLLAVVLCLPLLAHGGYPLARDLVFVPSQPWTWSSIGLGDGAPRAVPLDAVVSLVTSVVDGGVLARVVLPLTLAAAGWGAHRSVRGLGTVARLAAGGFAVWNPYVVERLALGQWALLMGYAALPWLAVAGRRLRQHGGTGDLAAVGAWLALASLTPTGGLLGTATALTFGVGRRARAGALVVLCLVLQLPWLVPSLLGPAAATSDPSAVDAFSAGAEGPGGVAVALLGLGGIWDAQAVPVTRDSWWAPATAAALLGALVLGRRVLRAALGRGDLARLAGLALVGLVLAAASSVPPGGDLVRWLVEQVPGAGLLRDSQKFLAPWALLLTLGLAAAVDRLAVTARKAGPEAVWALGLLAVPLPLVLLPDGAATVWPTVRPVVYPAGLARAARIVDEGPAAADVATLPWRSYRGFDWGNGLTSSDPATRWFDRDVLVSDVLQVGRTRVAGENRRGRALGEDLRTGPVAAALRAAHVTWGLVYRDDPAVGDLDLRGLHEVYADDDLALYRVPGASPPQPASGPLVRLLVLLADGLALGVAVVVVALAARTGRGRSVTASTSGAE